MAEKKQFRKVFCDARALEDAVSPNKKRERGKIQRLMKAFYGTREVGNRNPENKRTAKNFGRRRRAPPEAKKKKKEGSSQTAEKFSLVNVPRPEIAFGILTFLVGGGEALSALDKGQ